MENLQTEWSLKTLKKFNVSLDVVGRVHPQRPTIFVGNHISYFDIVLLMSTIPSVSFVAKQELSHWPLFGHAARKTKTIFVKREKNKSRKEARSAILNAVSQQQRVAVFPSGTTTLNENKSWRHGIFEVAQQSQTLVQPFRIAYQPLRSVAYIDDDFFPTHLVRLLRLKEIQAKIEFHEPVQILNPQEQSEYWQKWTQDPEFHFSNQE